MSIYTLIDGTSMLKSVMLDLYGLYLDRVLRVKGVVRMRGFTDYRRGVEKRKKERKKREAKKKAKRLSQVKKREERFFREVLGIRMQGGEKDFITDITDNEANLAKKHKLDSARIQRVTKLAFQYPLRKTTLQVFEEAGITDLNKSSSDWEIKKAVEAACEAARDCGFTDTIAQIFRDALRERLKNKLDYKAPAQLVSVAWKVAFRSEESKSHTSPTLEPWHNPVNGEKLANRIEKILRRYLVLPDHGSVAITLWTIHTYLLDAHDVSPFLAVTSPTPGCGKTTLLMVLERLVLNPETASNITGPGFFHRVDRFQPTMLIDEADSYAKQNPQLTTILNSSNRQRMAYVIRVKQRYSTWCAKCIAMIGWLQKTWQERSIEIRLFKKKASEKTKSVSDKELVRLKDFPSALYRWSADHIQGVKKQKPSRPPDLTDREFQNWSPLLAIAKEIGGKWLNRATEAAVALSASTRQRYIDTHEPIRLLADIRVVFSERMVFSETDAEKLWSAELVEALKALDDSLWIEKRLNTHRLASSHPEDCK